MTGVGVGGKVIGVAVGNGVGKVTGVGVAGIVTGVAVGKGVGKVTGVAVGNGVGNCCCVGVGIAVKADAICFCISASVGPQATSNSVMAPTVTTAEIAIGSWRRKQSSRGYHTRM